MELGVYVHIPFCRSKCHYCDFVSYPGRSEEEKKGYLAALLKETDLYREQLPGLRTETLYIGGGTPTCLTGGQLYALLESLGERLGMIKGAEVTVEGNPGTLDRNKLAALKEEGCTRLSLGVQSFNQQELELMGRIHTVREVYQTVEEARETGFDNINLDLMYGLPGQEYDQWVDTLQKVLRLAPEHLSLYQLNYEEGTPFYRLLAEGTFEQFDQETARRMHEAAIDLLQDSGYQHYEISNFALPGRQSRHNIKYWRNQEYLGLGAGASGYVSGVRYTNQSGLEDYCRAVEAGSQPVETSEVIDGDLMVREAVFLGLRLLEGLNKKEFYFRYGVKIEEEFKDALNDLVSKGLLANSPERVALTREGLYLANQVFMEFL
jgi:oxygen-independent coproporphyrinogen-3 oxidase